MQESSENEKNQLIEEIVEKQMKLEALQLKDALPVQALFIKYKHEIPFRWTIAVITVFIVLLAMLCGKHPRGFEHYFVEGVAWVLALYYLFVGAPNLIVPLFNGCDAFKNSPDRNKELSSFLEYIAPSVIAIGAVVTFFWWYLN